MTDEITYKEPLDIMVWLDAALRKEWEKHVATPVTPDLVAGYETAQAWGYVVAGYSMLEQGLKAILHLRGIAPPKTHALFVLFAELPAADQDQLRAHYDDFHHTFPEMNSFPLATLDDFLVNLDGARNSRGHYAGSFDWRYFLTEEGVGKPMPLVSIHVMHEVAYGCVRLVEMIQKGDGDAGGFVYSWRLQWNRSGRYRDWLTVRMNMPGWGQDHDRLEILWGPDYRDRYDYLVFEGDRIRPFFAPLPDVEESELPILDKRSELESFDAEEGFQRIGVTVSQSVRRSGSEPRHLMY